MRIVHIVPFFAPSRYLSGPVTITREICARQAARGHEVSVVTTDTAVADDQLPRNRWLEREGCHVFYASTNVLTARPPFFNPSAGRAMEQVIPDADVVHLHVALTWLNARARTVALRHGVPYVLTPRGVLEPERLRMRRLSKAAFLTIFERRVIRDAAKIHVLTRKEASDLTSLGAREPQLAVIPNAVDMGKPDEWPTRQEGRRRFCLPAEATVVLYLGRLMTMKGVELLIEAFARVVNAHRKAVLVLAGPDHAGQGAAAARLVERLGIAHAVRFVGPLQGEDKILAFRAADMFTLPSRSEGMPNAVLEAAAMGLPLLITDACNLPQVTEQQAGLVVRPDVKEVSHALHELIGDEAARQWMAANARRMAGEQFALSVVVERLTRMYEQLLPTAPASPTELNPPSSP